MKYLKYALYVILGLIIIFFLVGLLNPSVSYGYEVTVDKSAKEAWAVTQDESKYTEWLDGFKSIELLEGEKGTEGSKYKVIVNPGEGQPDFEMIETITSMNEYEDITMHFDNEAMDFEQTITFTEGDGGTTIKTDSKVIGKGMMTRSMFAVMEMLGGAFTKQEGKNMENLKRLVNENTTDYYPEPVDEAASEMDESAEGAATAGEEG